MSCSPHNSEGWFLVVPPSHLKWLCIWRYFDFYMSTAATMENWQSAELLCQAQLASLYLPCFSMLSDTRMPLNDERWFVPCLFLPRPAWLILPHHTCFYKLILQTNIVFSIMPCSPLKSEGRFLVVPPSHRMWVLYLKCFLFVYVFKGIVLTESANDEATSWNWSAMQWKGIRMQKKTEQLAAGRKRLNSYPLEMMCAGMNLSAVTVKINDLY